MKINEKILAIIKLILYNIERFVPFYISIVTREKRYNSTNLQRYDQFLNITTDFAILIQGPIITQNNFTVETLKLYRHIYPNVTLVFSTWENSISENNKKVFEALNVHLLENKLPSNRGVVNINLQIKSTSTGIRFLKSNGVNYVLKVRSDQRAYNNIDFLTYMRCLQLMYPQKMHNCPLSERLVICSLNTFKDRLYGISDMLMFGSIDDMALYWDIPFDSVYPGGPIIFPNPKFYMKNFLGEGYLVNNFFKKVEFSPKWEYEDSDDFITDYFIIVDKEQLDLFWLKYNRFFESINILPLDDFKIKRRMNYINWILKLKCN